MGPRENFGKQRAGPLKAVIPSSQIDSKKRDTVSAACSRFDQGVKPGWGCEGEGEAGAEVNI
jgi:hypothetical protein